jgi:hypothetical protein
MENDLLDAIRNRINAGDREGARLELVAFLKSEPDNTDAWALLAILLKDPAEQVECYRQILRVNPDDRQAATWIEALSPQLPKAQDREALPTSEERTLQCPQCGGITKVRFVGELFDNRAFCPHCGSQIELPDTFQRVERRREQEHLSEGSSRIVDPMGIETRRDHAPGQGSALEASDIDRVLRDLDLPGAEDETLQQPGEQGVLGGASEQILPPSGTGTEQRGLMDRMLRRMRGEAVSGGGDAAALEQAGGLPLPGRLSPEDIIQLAGGPLPPEERRKCPKCGAVVSHKESRCPWCSALISGADEL